MDKIRKIVEEAIPLDPKCEVKRRAEIARRAKLRIAIEELVREVKPYDPRTETK
jgi:hypothetical protein